MKVSDATPTSTLDAPTPQSDGRSIALLDRAGNVVGHALVDAEDHARLNRWTWRLSHHGYAVRSEYRHGKKRTIYMHRELANPPSGLVVDHVNRDPLDNRRANLRLATTSQNNANSAHRRNRTGYRGVYRHGRSGRFVAQISVLGRIKSLGLHDTPEAAGLAYDRAATQARIAFAQLNFPLPHTSSVP